MLLLSSRGLPPSYPILALIATNLVISMPAPAPRPSKRSTERLMAAENGFSNVPKILEIQLPLKIASKEDLVAWAKYVMGLMASKINITLTTVKELPTGTTSDTRIPDQANGFDHLKQSQMARNSLHSGSSSANGARAASNRKLQENPRYGPTENTRHIGNAKRPERVRIPGHVKQLGDARRSENVVSRPRNGNPFSSKDKLPVDPRLTTFAVNGVGHGVTSNSLLDGLRTRPLYSTVGFFDATVPVPLDITDNINLPRAKESIFKNAFGTTKLTEPQLFVPEIPDFRLFSGVKEDAFARNLTSVSPPARAYLPVTTTTATATTDNVNIPNNPFVTRYFFDGVDANVTDNLAVFPADIVTDQPLILDDRLPLPIKSVVDLFSRGNSSDGGAAKPLLRVPFEALITFTREKNGDRTTTTGNDRDRYFLIPTRDPLDVFPPYFDTNYTLTNESDQISVVLDDGKQFTEPVNDRKKEERKKQERKQDSSKRQQQKPKKSKSDERQPSVIGRLLRTFVALRRNNSLATSLSPPPLNAPPVATTQRAPIVQNAPTAQRYPPPPRIQNYGEKRPSTSRQGRRNQTSLTQEIEEDDDSGSNSASSQESTEDTSSDENRSNGGDDAESDDGSDDGNDDDNSSSNESSSSQSDYDDSSEEEGGLVQALIDLLQLAAPILEDLSDPESDADVGEVLSAAIPLLEELSEGDGDTPGFDIPGISVPVLLKFSEDENGPKDSASILTPLLQLIAPIIGPIIGPLIVPLSQQSSNPPGKGGSSVSDLIMALSGPLLQPIGYGKMTPLSNLIATVISGFSKVSTSSGSDISSLVKALVAGSIAGSSAGSSGGKDSYGASTGYGGDSYAAAPSKSQNPLLLLGSSITDFLNAIAKVVASLVAAITGILGASSSSSTEPEPQYGPPRPAYGPPPRPAYGPPPRPTYGPPPRPAYGSPQSYSAPSRGMISITTSSPRRVPRL